MSLTDLPVFV